MRSGSGRRDSDVKSGELTRSPAIGGKLDAVARLEVVRARLGILTGETTDAHHGHLHAVNQHQRHLQQDLEPVGNDFGPAFVKNLGAVAALQQEAIARLGLGELLPQVEDFPGRHQRRQFREVLHRTLQCLLILVPGLLQRIPCASRNQRPSPGPA